MLPSSIHVGYCDLMFLSDIWCFVIFTQWKWFHSSHTSHSFPLRTALLQKPHLIFVTTVLYCFFSKVVRFIFYNHHGWDCFFIKLQKHIFVWESSARFVRMIDSCSSGIAKLEAWKDPWRNHFTKTTVKKLCRHHNLLSLTAGDISTHQYAALDFLD